MGLPCRPGRRAPTPGHCRACCARSATPPTGGSRWPWPSRRSPRACGWSRWSGRSSGSAAGPAQLSIVSTAGAVGVLLPALLGGVVADRVPQKRILLAVAAVELAGMAVVATAVAHRPHPGLAARRRLVRHRRWAWRSTTRPTRPGCPSLVDEADLHGRQRLRGDGPPHARPGDRPGRRRCRRGGGLGRRRGGGRGRPRAGRPARADARPADPGPPRPRRPTRTRAAPWPRPCATCARASSTWCARRGCSPRCCSPR